MWRLPHGTIPQECTLGQNLASLVTPTHHHVLKICYSQCWHNQNTITVLQNRWPLSLVLPLEVRRKTHLCHVQLGSHSEAAPSPVYLVLSYTLYHSYRASSSECQPHRPSRGRMANYSSLLGLFSYQHWKSQAPGNTSIPGQPECWTGSSAGISQHAVFRTTGSF